MVSLFRDNRLESECPVLAKDLHIKTQNSRDHFQTRKVFGYNREARALTDASHSKILKDLLTSAAACTFNIPLLLFFSLYAEINMCREHCHVYPR